jgi:exonuclease SbcD
MNILEAVKNEKADILLISGDLYEHRYVTRRTMEWLFSVLLEAEVPVVIIPGNHDPFIKNSWYRFMEWPSNVHILTPDNPYLILEELKTAVYGIGFSAYKEETPDLSKVSPPKKGYFNILMFHGTLDMDFDNQAYHPVTSGELKALGYDYYALGHFHNIRQDYALKNAINPGSPEPLGFDEPGLHGAFVVELKEEQGQIKAEAKFFPTAVREYKNIILDISDCERFEDIKAKISALKSSLNPQKDLVRITLKGRTDLNVETRMLTEIFTGDWLYADIRDHTRKAFDLDSLSKDPSIKGAFVREIQSMLSNIESDLKNDPDNEGLMAMEEKLNLALCFGLEALINGRIEWWDD